MNMFDRMLLLRMNRKEPSMAARIFGGALMVIGAICSVILGILALSPPFVLFGVITLLVLAIGVLIQHPQKPLRLVNLGGMAL